LEFEDKNISNIERARIIAEVYGERPYISNIIKCDDFYVGNQESYLPYIGEETEANYSKRPKLWINFTQPIVDKRASVYEGQAARTIDGNDNYKTILEDKVWDGKHHVFQEIDLKCELAPFCCVRVSYDSDEDKIIYTPYSAQNAFPYISEETGELEAMCLRWFKEIRKEDDKIEIVLYEQCWDKEMWREYEDGEPIPGREGVHNYGKLPFVFFFSDQRSRSYFLNPPVYDVVEQNYNINTVLSDLRYVCQYQSFGQLVLTVKSVDGAGNPLNDKGQPLNTTQLKAGIGRFLVAPEYGKIEFIHPNAAIKELMDVVDFLINNLYTTSHVPKVTLAPSETTASGVSLIVQWYPLVGLLNKKRSSFRVSEEELVEMSLLVHERNKGKTDKLKDYTFTLNFDEGSAPKSAEEQIKIDKFEIGIGVTSATEILMRKDPDLKEDKAVEKLKKNEKINREILSVRTALSDNEEDAFDKSIENLKDKKESDKKKKKKKQVQ